MLTYIKPVVLDCGESAQVIKGQCGWGTENWTLDKTGSREGATRRVRAQIACPGPGVTICHVCRTTTNACSTDTNKC